MEAQVFSRLDDGSFPVRTEKLPDGQTVFLVERDEDVALYSSARQLLISLTGHPEARHWTFSRYFRLGKYARRTEEPAISIAEMFQPRPVEVVAVTGAGATPVFRTSQGLTTLGVDLERRGHEVAKLLFHGFGDKIRAASYDPDDVLQEVYKGVIIRNAGACPFDPRKSSFGHYVHMICNCVVSNFHRKQSRVRSMEQVGAVGYDDGECGEVDVASDAARLPAKAYLGSEGERLEEMEEGDLMTVIRRGSRNWTADAQLAWKIVPLVRQGMSRTEIAEIHGVKKAVVSRALKVIRVAVKQWLNG